MNPDAAAAAGPPAPRAYRRSPIIFDAVPSEIERRDGWDVVLAYEEGVAPSDAKHASRLVDLTHRRRWDYQDRRIDQRRPFGIDVPASPGEVSVLTSLMVSRMNATQASIWHVGLGDPPPASGDVGLTETTDSHGWLAVIGAATPSVMERVTSLDLFPPDRPAHPPSPTPPPFLTQGPVLHVPCQIVTWGRDCVLIALSRGYGQTFVDALLRSLAGCGPRAGDLLLPGGERVFTEWLEAAGHVQ